MVSRRVGIACEEYTAVCIDTAGIATVYGEYPDYEDLGIFFRSTVRNPITTTMHSGQPSSGS